MRNNSFLYSLILHAFVLAFLIIELSFQARLSSSSSSSSQPIIQATAVSQSVLDNYEQQVEAAKEEKIKEQQQKIEQQKEILKQQQLQKQLEIQKQQQIQQQKLQSQKAEEAAKQKAEQAAAKQAQINKTKEMKKALQKSLAQDLQKQLSKEETKANTQTHTQTTTSTSSSSMPSINQGELDKYKALIIQAISGQWIVPPNLPQNISCELQVRVAPGGVVTEVSVIKSSGNPVLDNSAVAAVNKASPLPVPQESSLFNQFRELHLTVNPDGSMMEN